MHKILLAALVSLALAACGSSGGTDNPPAPPAPIEPPEPTFEERLADLAAHDPNECRARTPGFEALGGWLKNDGREIGASRVWLRDAGDLDGPLAESHGARVNATFDACSVRPIARYAHRSSLEEIETMLNETNPSHGLLVSSSYSHAGPRQLGWFDLLHHAEDVEHDVMLILALGNGNGNSTSRTVGGEYATSLNEALKPDNVGNARWILVGGYTGTGDDRAPARDLPGADGGLIGSSLCGDAEPLCLFAPWQSAGQEEASRWVGTSHATPQVSAALDTVWASWPDMDILDLRNLAFDCAENQTADGVSNTERTFSYSSGRSFTSTTNSTWGHGILSLTCLFTPNGGLQDPTTGEAISGGIYGPLAGPIAGASISGVDYTGRDFGYGFARPVARENPVLAITANLAASERRFRNPAVSHGAAAYNATLAQTGRVRIDLAASDNAIGAALGWRASGFTLRAGLAVQPEGAGPLIGTRAFRAPATLSGALTAAYGRTLARSLSVHVQADHWRSIATHQRSLWEDAQFRESRINASLVQRWGRHELALQGVWRSGLSGALTVSGRAWKIGPQAEAGVWLSWRRKL